MVALVLRTIEAFKVFDLIWIMTRGGPANSTRTLSILVYQEAFAFQRAGSGASLALMVTLMITVLAVAYLMIMRGIAGEAPVMEHQSPAVLDLRPCHGAAGRGGHPGAARMAVHHERVVQRRPVGQAAALVAGDAGFLPLCHAVDRGRELGRARPSSPRCATASELPAWRRSRRWRSAFPPAGPSPGPRNSAGRWARSSPPTCCRLWRCRCRST